MNKLINVVIKKLDYHTIKAIEYAYCCSAIKYNYI